MPLWKQKLASRKFWVAISPLVIALVVELTGTELPITEEAFLGVAGVLMAYLLGQSWVDKEAVKGQAVIVGNENMLQAQAYIKYLEAQLPQEENVMPFPTGDEG